MSDYIENGEWEIVSIPVNVENKKYQCCPSTFTELTYRFRMRRKVLYYLFNLILPCAIISTLAILAFCINPRSGQRITLSITVMLTMSVFLNFAWSRLPVTSDSVPLLAKYYMVIMTVIGLSLFANCVTLNYFYRDQALSYLPRWFRIKFITWLAKVISSLFCTPYPSHTRVFSHAFSQGDNSTYANRNGSDENVVMIADSRGPMQSKPRVKIRHQVKRERVEPKQTSPEDILKNTTTHALVAEAKEHYMLYKESRKNREEDDVDVLIGNNVEHRLLNDLEDHRQFTAMIIDQFFFIFFLFIFVLSMTVLLSGDTMKYTKE